MSAHAGDVEALRSLLGHAFWNPDNGGNWTRIAETVLASDWLDAVRRKAGDERADLFETAIEAEWFNGNIAEDVLDRLLARIARESR